jgi:hypothetical protein
MIIEFEIDLQRTNFTSAEWGLFIQNNYSAVGE